jgi:hypothetical protein
MTPHPSRPSVDGLEKAPSRDTLKGESSLLAKNAQTRGKGFAFLGIC